MIRRLIATLRPVDGAGSRSWGYDLCPATSRDHTCDERGDHGHRHVCSCGFRFAMRAAA